MSLVRLHVYTGTSELSLLAVAICTKNNVNFHLNNYQIQMVDKSACIRHFVAIPSMSVHMPAHCLVKPVFGKMT